MIKQKRLDHWTRLRDEVRQKEKKMKFEAAKVGLDELFESKRILKEQKAEREKERLSFWEEELRRDREENAERRRRNAIFREEQERVFSLARREFLMCMKEDEGLWRTVCFFVLFCFVLFCFVLFCFVLFCFVLFCFLCFLFCFVVVL